MKKKNDEDTRKLIRNVEDFDEAILHLIGYIADIWNYDVDPTYKLQFHEWELYMSLMVAIVSEN